jgi:hypothetical protein
MSDRPSLEVGPGMDRSFLAGEQGEDAPPPPPPPPPPPAEPPFNMSELQHFPMRAKCLSTHTTLPDLPPHQRTRFLRYLTDAVEGLPVEAYTRPLLSST